MGIPWPLSPMFNAPAFPQQILTYGGFPKLGLPFWGPNNKDHSIFGSILGSPYLGKPPYVPNARGLIEGMVATRVRVGLSHSVALVGRSDSAKELSPS